MPAKIFMGQKSGHTKLKRSPNLYGYQILEQEEQEESNEKENNKGLEKSSKQFDEILGMADSRNGAVGLYNIGLSCCINSLLQSFLMNRYFTSILRRINVPFGTAERKASVPYQMLLLLESMQRAKGKSVRPFDLIYCLSYHGVRCKELMEPLGYHLDMFVLHDASEVYYKIWNLLKDQIADTDLVERLTDLYTTRLQELLVCQKCSHEIKIDSKRLMLHLPMFDFDSHRIINLENSLHCFFRPEQLTKENMCHCEKCNKKTEHMRNDGLYDLFAVIAHSGPADFGHYCAYIWSLTEHKWYCFNDSSVCEVSWDDIKCTYGRQSLSWGETAYLLVYMRKNSTSL
ncbi:hypothetical protein E2320_004283 [Naja naja]|nr:hypothetical protein E2320_004283 [Naja naja]